MQFTPFKDEFFAFFTFWGWILRIFNFLRANSLEFKPFKDEFFEFFTFWGWILRIFYPLKMNFLQFSPLRVNSLHFFTFKGWILCIFDPLGKNFLHFSPFEQNHGLTPLEKSQFFDYLNFFFLYLRKAFFRSWLSLKKFSCPILPKKQRW